MKPLSCQAHRRSWPARFSSLALNTLLLFIYSGLSGLTAQAGPHDVGIIPQTAGGCPVGSERVFIAMDDEDRNNISSVSGWTGTISRSATGTMFMFCRVDGTRFTSVWHADYAVLQLGTTCPAGSVSISRLFDNEDNRNANWSSGNTSPSTVQSFELGFQERDTKMFFCYFPTRPLMVQLPNFYIPYGVFAGPSSEWFASGLVFTDDEDSGNSDYTETSSPWVYHFARIIYGNDSSLKGRNSYLRVAKAANDTCNYPCPYIGSYDGANCWVGQPPAGTKAFIWANNFYYTPVNRNQCPRPGSWFDDANCFVRAIPPQTSPFIWSNMWYVAPVCRP